MSRYRLWFAVGLLCVLAVAACSSRKKNLKANAVADGRRDHVPRHGSSKYERRISCVVVRLDSSWPSPC